MLIIKPGVRLDGLQTPILLAAQIVDRIYERNGVHKCRLTSGTDGLHMKGSYHHCGKALDFGATEIPPEVRNDIKIDIEEALGPEFDVLLHGTPIHFHIEYDPA